MDVVSTAIVANAAVVIGGIALWLGYRTRRAERLEQLERERAQLYLAPVEARMSEISRALDALAIEVERVAEGQRYLAARELPRSPRPLTALPDATGRIITPH